MASASHRRVPLEVREALAARDSSDRVVEVLRREALCSGALVLSTCNRFEAWAVGPAAPVGLAPALDLAARAPGGTFEVLTGAPALLHAVRVAAGLDSMAWGEPQIALQVAACRARARAEGASSPALDLCVAGISSAGARVRSAAGLSPASAGTADVAAALLRSRLEFPNPRVLVLGTGSMGRLLALRISEFASVTVAGRDAGRASLAARAAGASAAALDEALADLASFDAAVVALGGPDVGLTADALAKAASVRRGPLVVLDLSVPRAVAPGQHPLVGLVLLNIDDLRATPGNTPDPRSVRRADEAAARFSTAIARRIEGVPAERTVGALHRRALRVAREEAARASARLSGDPLRDREVVEKLALRVARKLMHPPTEALRGVSGVEESSALEAAARRLFKIEAEEEKDDGDDEEDEP